MSILWLLNSSKGRDDGSLRPNFKPMKVDENFTIDSYAIGVMNELRDALKGLVEEGDSN